MARLFITHPTGTWVHSDEEHKTCGLPVSRNPTRVPCTSTWLLGRPSAGRKAAARGGGACPQSLSGPRLGGPGVVS